MLGKLLKYDWRYSWRLLAVINAALLVYSLLGRIALALPVRTDNNVYAFFLMVYTFLYVLMIAGSFLLTHLLLVFRYYRNFYTEEGYLLHTLPVTTGEKIWAKFINHLAWLVINILCICGAVLILAGPEAWEDCLDFLPRLLSSVEETFGIPAFLFLLLLLIGALVFAAFTIFSFYFSVSVGSLFRAHKILASVITYVILYTVIQCVYLLYIIITGIVLWQNSVELSGSNVTFISEAGPYDSICSPAAFGIAYSSAVLLLLAGTAVFYGFSYYVAKKKLNLD